MSLLNEPWIQSLRQQGLSSRPPNYFNRRRLVTAFIKCHVAKCQVVRKTSQGSSYPFLLTSWHPHVSRKALKYSPGRSTHLKKKSRMPKIPLRNEKNVQLKWKSGLTSFSRMEFLEYWMSSKRSIGRGIFKQFCVSWRYPWEGCFTLTRNLSTIQ